MEGKKYDAGKPDWSLLPLDAVEEVVRVLTFGAGKHSREGWRTLPDANNRNFAAAMRHLVAFRRGDTQDVESGCSNLAHAICRLMFMLEAGNDEEAEKTKSEVIIKYYLLRSPNMTIDGKPFSGSLRDAETDDLVFGADEYTRAVELMGPRDQIWLVDTSGKTPEAVSRTA